MTGFTERRAEYRLSRLYMCVVRFVGVTRQWIYEKDFDTSSLCICDTHSQLVHATWLFLKFAHIYSNVQENLKIESFIPCWTEQIEYNTINMGHEEAGCVGVDGIHLARGNV
jgi:hypothetical protein